MIDCIRSNMNVEVDRTRSLQSPSQSLCPRSTYKHNMIKATELGPHSFKANTNLAFGVGGNREACLVVDVLFGE